jgi:hypothetical protein
MSARVEDDTMKLGLLMEAAQAQQSLTTEALGRLREHVAGLDGVIRDEIRNTLVEEMHALGRDSDRASEALRRLQHTASLRLITCTVVVLTSASLIPLGVAWCVLPTRLEIDALRARRNELTSNIDRLTHQGGKVDLRHCGQEQRLCVRVDRSAPAYGDRGEFVVVKGY